MKSLACLLRLNVATLSTTLVLLAAPLMSIAQDETVPGEQQSSEPAPAVRKLFVSDKLVLNVYS
jgi:hypothetical protein